ncbi:hypothetical protein [Salmon gill poxvirus]|nr:hypothetical protein [Salmon gill poxvirus]
MLSERSENIHHFCRIHFIPGLTHDIKTVSRIDFQLSFYELCDTTDVTFDQRHQDSVYVFIFGLFVQSDNFTILTITNVSCKIRFDFKKFVEIVVVQGSDISVIRQQIGEYHTVLSESQILSEKSSDVIDEFTSF